MTLIASDLFVQATAFINRSCESCNFCRPLKRFVFGLNGPRNISSALDGGNGPLFDYETSAPYNNSVFGGAGISANFGDRWSASVFYNVNFGGDGYTNNIISTTLGLSF